MNQSVYSIGYATKSLDTFLSQLKAHGISAVVDVRSVPFSKAFAEYHQPAIKQSLRNNGIHYIHMGDELGPRSKDPAHYNENNQVQFDRLMKANLFLKGVDRVINGVNKGHTICLMCAEKDPLNCHRTLLVGYYLLREKNINVAHILHDGELADQEQIEAEMVERHGSVQDLFLSDSELIDRAWQCQCTKSNYVKSVE